MKKNTLVKLASAVAVILIAAILMIINATVLAPERHKGSKTVSLSITYADMTYEYKNLKTETQTVADLLHEYDKALDLRLDIQKGPYGEFITSLKNVAQNKQTGAYYTFTINGEYAEYGISEQPIADGDSIEFSFGITEYDGDWNKTGYTLAPSAKLQDKPVSAGYIAMWVCCGVGIAAGIAVAVYALIEYLHDRKEGKDRGH